MKLLRRVGVVLATILALTLCLPYMIMTALGVWLHTLQERVRGRHARG